MQVGSDSAQGAGAPTMFQAMRRIVDCLVHNYVGESIFERSIRQSFLGMLIKILHVVRVDGCLSIFFHDV